MIVKELVPTEKAALVTEFGPRLATEPWTDRNAPYCQ